MILSLRFPLVPLSRETLNGIGLHHSMYGRDKGWERGIPQMLVQLLLKPIICALIWPLLLHRIFFTENLKEEVEQHKSNN